MQNYREKNSWITISWELGHKSEAPQVFAKLQNKNSSIMILGELEDKSEAQRAFARMFTSLLHDQQIQKCKEKNS